MTAKKIITICIISILVIVVSAIAVLGWYVYNDYKFLISSKDIIKANAVSILSIAKSDSINVKEITRRTERIESVLYDIDAMLDNSLWQKARSIKKYGEYIVTADKALDIAFNEIDNLALPGLHVLQENPVFDFVTDDGYRVGYIKPILEFVESAIPICESLMDDVRSLDISFAIDNSTVEGYLSKAEDLFNLYYDNIDYVNLLKTIFGDGEEKYYFILCQNTAEIKAGGGFYGSMCIMHIKDGLLSLSDFGTSWSYLPSIHASSVITSQEYNIFGLNMFNPRDLAYCPDFERSASILYQDIYYKNGIHVNGIISLSPAIIQRLLKYAGEIELSNGEILNGDNATKYIQSDIYYQYQAAGMDALSNNDYVDSLFGEIANLTLEKVFGNLSLDTILGYIDAVEISRDKRELMLWMQNSDEQVFITELGFSGRMNFNSAKPEVGVYFTCSDPNKLGVFFDKNIEIYNKRKNDNGSYTYDVKISFKNCITQDEINRGGYQWIAGGWSGSIRAFAYFCAPAGGKIDSIYSAQGKYILKTNYMGLDMGYNMDLLIAPGETLEFYMTVTTSTDAEEELGINTNPTLQEFMRPQTTDEE